MKIILISFLIFEMVLLGNSHPTRQKVDGATIEELEELEKLLRKELNNEEIERKLRVKVVIDEQKSLNDEEELLEDEEEEELQKNGQEREGENERAEKRLDRPNLLKRWKTPWEEEEGNNEEERDSDDQNNDDANLSNLEAMEIAVNGKVHLVQGLHPEDSQKAQADSHDKHLYTQAQLNEILNDRRRGHKRNFDRYVRLWEQGIVPYKIYNMSTSSKDVIEKAIQQMNTQTCVKWIEQSQAPTNLGHTSAVYFIAESGCWSYVGRVKTVQPLSLQEPGCVSVSTSIHEMLHAMGGHHEQSRSDRDDYVTINWNNVNGGTGNFNMKKLSTFDNNAYDAESSMQYSLYAFSTNGQKTIQFKDQRLEFLADSADGLEFYDIADVTKAYGCTTNCNNPPSCQNGGFVNHQCVCLCPDSLSGSVCETPVSTGNCGGIINIGDGETKYIESPNYSSGGNYPTGLDCTWLIKGSQGKMLRASVQYMDIAASGKCQHWLEYRYNLLGQRGPKKCGTNFVADSELWDTTKDELPNTMIIKFNSKDTSAQAKRGFRIKLNSIGTGCLNNKCVMGQCVANTVDNSYTCNCNPGVSGTNCDVLSPTAVFTSGFEFGEHNIFVNVGGDQFDWSINNGGTPSSNTGPAAAKEGYQYAYIETSSPRVQGDKAVMETTLNFPKTERCLKFWYHMYGGSIGTLNVYTEGTGVSKGVLWTMSGDQGGSWKEAKVDIPAMAALKITVEGVRGGSWNGDIAIDAFTLSPGSCSSPVTPAPTTPAPTTQQPTTAAPTTPQPTTPAPTTPQPTTPAPTTPAPTTPAPTTPQPTTQQPTTGSEACTFETGTNCFLVDEQNDDWDWTVRSGSTPSSGTGPSKAYEGNNYAFMEMSSPVQNGDVARFASRSSLSGSDNCLTFAYHMLGSVTMGKLQVHTGVSSPQNEAFSVEGSQGDKWNNAFVSLTGVAGQKVFISASRGGTWKGDIAIDDVKLYNQACSNFVSPCVSDPCQNSGQCEESAGSYVCRCATGYVGNNCEFKDSTNVGEFRCTIESGEECIFEETGNDAFDWTRKSGGTSSADTGPDAAYQGTYYLYIETSSPRVDGDNAVLSTSANLLQGNVDYCLSFFYHMYSIPGTLRVTVAERQSPTTQSEVFSLSGNQGNQWQLGTASIPPTFSDPVVFIEGIRGSSYKGDIAIDDILLSKRKCDTISVCRQNPCQNGGSCIDRGGSYTCQCLTGFTGTTCDSQDTLNGFVCTFESGSPCGFENVNDNSDEFDWTERQGGTPSSNTGPAQAYEGQRYMYIETSSPRVDGDTAILSTVNTALASGSPFCLSFMYHMKVSSSSIDVYAGNGMATDYIWGLTGQQSDDDKWKPAVLDIPAFNTPVIEIIGTRGTSWRGDIAIDDLSLTQGACQTKR